jgi:predicted nuclease of predicted toxin-antitoxin system
MRSRPQAFLLDENMPRKMLTSLRREGINTTRVYDVRELRSQADATIFAYARAYQMTIITFDTDYLNKIAFPPPHAGILVLRFFPRDISVSELVSVVLKAVAQLDLFDPSNRVYRLAPDGLEEEL